MNTKKLLALLLALVMILCAIPVVYAAVDDPAVKDDSDVSVDIEDLPATGEEEVLYGDVDGNGVVTPFDAVIILRSLAGWDVTVNSVVADADGNGEVTPFDAVIILRSLAGWDVTLGPAS